jgi:hypothetical protein
MQREYVTAPDGVSQHVVTISRAAVEYCDVVTLTKRAALHQVCSGVCPNVFDVKHLMMSGARSQKMEAMLRALLRSSVA